MVIWGYKKLWGKKGTGQGGYDDIIRYLRTSIKQVKPNKKTSYDSTCNHRTTFENMAEN